MKNFIEDVVTLEVSGVGGVFSSSYKIIAPKEFFERLGDIQNNAQKTLHYQGESLSNDVDRGYKLPSNFKVIVGVRSMNEDEGMKRAAKIMNEAIRKEMDNFLQKKCIDPKCPCNCRV